MKKLIYEIKQEAKKLSVKNDEDFRIAIKKVKARRQKEPLKNLIIEWFALVQEASFRAIGLRHFDTQILAGLLLYEGKIVEMKTGEGKTLVSTLPVSLNALSDRGAHVVTVNDYLAERDKKWMGKIYNKLDLTIGLVKSTSTLVEKQKSYNSDITYVTNSELVFDFLRDSSAYNLNEVVQRPFNFCLIDEIDSVLIDEARTPLILSTLKETTNINKLYLAKAVASSLERNLHFQLDEKRKDINLTEIGYKEAKTRLGKKTLYDPDDPWILDILNALKAKYLFHLNKDYIVLNNKVVIVDEFTGRIMEDRRWSMGLHESVEIKEKVLIGGGTKTKSSITYQNFFTLYPILSGMSGTAKTTEKEFKDIYNLDVIVLPTVKPLIRQDLPDFVYQTEVAKWKNVLSLSKKCYEKGQPILIGTSTINKSEFLSDLFKASNIPHQVLNAKPENVTRESEIIAQAGERFAVTIATNMAGRGTDIILGGNPSFKIKRELYEALIEKKENLEEDVWKDYLSEDSLKKDIEGLPYSLDDCKDSLKSLYKIFAKNIFFNWEKENKLVKALGGLFVLGTERHETRRIDNQLRGRSGRQGDPGVSQFFVSLEDDLIKVFGGDSIRKWVDFLIQDKDTPLESDLLTKSLKNAQKKVELYNYELRKNVFEYDDILNTQRKQLFNTRKELLSENLYENLFLRFSEGTFDEILKTTANNSFLISSTEKKLANFASYAFLKKAKKGGKKAEANFFYKEIWISHDLRLSKSNFYQLGFLKSTRAIIFLSVLDFFWTEHIERMNYIRETINWRSYGQQNPLIEYNTEAFNSFKQMFEQIRSCMLYYFLNNPINYS
jgi:preprotein translocase subunit SecA